MTNQVGTGIVAPNQVLVPTPYELGVGPNVQAHRAVWSWRLQINLMGLNAPPRNQVLVVRRRTSCVLAPMVCSSSRGWRSRRFPRSPAGTGIVIAPYRVLMGRCRTTGAGPNGPSSKHAPASRLCSGPRAGTQPIVSTGADGPTPTTGTVPTVKLAPEVGLATCPGPPELGLECKPHQVLGQCRTT
jgi:hypothetical protein